jgi:three-Cys-motif partner protein
LSSFVGGQWTDKKLRALQRYLEAYMKLMEGKPSAARPFTKVYFDAFCGSGSRIGSEASLFAGQELQQFSEFSPRVALSIKPAFDRYVFCDSKKAHVERLRSTLQALGLRSFARQPTGEIPAA